MSEDNSSTAAAVPLPSKPTPGPWTAERQDDDYGEIYWAVHAVQDYRFIANVCSCEADARMIISAAPLLAALKRARVAIKALHGPGQWDIYEKHSPEMKQIDTALAKAEGQS